MAINIAKPFVDDLARCPANGLVTNHSPHVRMFEDKLQEFLGLVVEVQS